MKILAFVDTHGNKSAINRIQKKAKSADIVISAGDLSVFGRDLEIIVYTLNRIGKPVLIVPGNHETKSELKAVCSLFPNTVYLHKTSFRKDGCLFLGYGGGGFSLRDREFERHAPEFRKLVKKGEKVILVTHAPPHGTKVDLIMDEHCGNKSFRKFIERVDISLVVCGHLHENADKDDRIGKTVVVNPGPFGRIIEL
ncbi:MAG: metallophosphoesterase [archaeon]